MPRLTVEASHLNLKLDLLLLFHEQHQVVQEGEYRDEMEGLWIQVNDWVTYVLAKHFDLQSRPNMH